MAPRAGGGANEGVGACQLANRRTIARPPVAQTDGPDFTM